MFGESPQQGTTTALGEKLFRQAGATTRRFIIRAKAPPAKLKEWAKTGGTRIEEIHEVVEISRRSRGRGNPEVFYVSNDAVFSDLESAFPGYVKGGGKEVVEGSGRTHSEARNEFGKKLKSETHEE